MGADRKAGGFLTGWRGQLLFIGGVAVIAALAATGIAARRNTKVLLANAEVSRINPESNDFGIDFFGECIIRNVTYPRGDWEYEFPGGGSSVELRDTDVLVQLGELWNGGSSTVRYNYRPEHACYAVCQKQLGDDCRTFVYDGISNDACRFLAPGKTLPPSEPKLWDDEPYFYSYDATCMFDIRQEILKALDAPKPGIVRPRADTLPTPSGPSFWGNVDYYKTIEQTYLFFKAQWSGILPSSFKNDIPWRKAGFNNLGVSCGQAKYTGSFATGDHIVSTMAIAEEVGILSLGYLWWDIETYEASGSAEAKRLAIDEIGRQADFLASAWDSDAEELLVGIGDQFAPEGRANGSLATYTDFGTADLSLAIGAVTSEGRRESVSPECSYTVPSKPAAETAAHTAAALALASMVFRNYTTNTDLPDEWETKAEELLAYSLDAAPLSRAKPTGAGDFPEDQKFGVDFVYPIEKSFYTSSHQLWAACVLHQATGKAAHWDTTLDIYERWIRNGKDTRLYFPLPNYSNPVWYGLLCMAQSSPSATGLEFRAELELTPEQQSDDFLNQEFANGTRLEVMEQLWSNFVAKWIDVTDAGDTSNKIALTGTAADDQRLRWLDLRDPNDDAVPGMLRNSANAAWISLMFADLPGALQNRSLLARCMAKQTVDFILGENALGVDGDNFSFLVGADDDPDSYNFPNSPYHKDAACPEAEVRGTQFNQTFETIGDGTGTNAFNVRVCDSVTFLGAAPAPADAAKDIPAYANPVLHNQYTLTGALVSHFDPDCSESCYTDRRATGRGETSEANLQSRVALDQSAALTNAAAGLMALPASFFGAAQTDCPDPLEMAAQLRAQDPSTT